MKGSRGEKTDAKFATENNDSARILSTFVLDTDQVRLFALET